MEDQPDFSFIKGKAEAESGMDKASAAGRVHHWQVDAGRWFMLLPVGHEFSADDLIKAVGLPDEGVNKNNVVGAFFNSLAKSRFIKWTGKTMKSERIDRHTGMNRIWFKVR
jgi:hypothetical protein